MKLWMILFYVVGLAFSPEGIADICKNACNYSNLLIVFYVQIMPDDFVMQLHRF